MKISREFAIAELESCRKVLGQWLRELKSPDIDPSWEDGKVPEFLSIEQIGSIPSGQLRAELTACAAKLEAIAQS